MTSTGRKNRPRRKGRKGGETKRRRKKVEKKGGAQAVRPSPVAKKNS